VRFERAVNEVAALQGAYCQGLQALSGEDRQRVRRRIPGSVTGSINLDSALKHSLPNEPRWDYGIGVARSRGRDKAVWVEVHPASSQHIDEVLRKLAWLKDWLKRTARALDAMSQEYVWVASGRVAIPAGSRHRKILAQKGLRFAGRQLEIK
jgi:hypothetical protein